MERASSPFLPTLHAFQRPRPDCSTPRTLFSPAPSDKISMLLSNTIARNTLQAHRQGTDDVSREQGCVLTRLSLFKQRSELLVMSKVAMGAQPLVDHTRREYNWFLVCALFAGFTYPKQPPGPSHKLPERTLRWWFQAAFVQKSLQLRRALCPPPSTVALYRCSACLLRTTTACWSVRNTALHMAYTCTCFPNQAVLDGECWRAAHSQTHFNRCPAVISLKKSLN